MSRRYYIRLHDSTHPAGAHWRGRRTHYLLAGIAILVLVVMATWYILDIRFPSSAMSDKLQAGERTYSSLTDSSVPGVASEVEPRDTSVSATRHIAAGIIGLQPEPIRIQVLNGCGVKGLAKLISPALRAKGFDVRETRNAGSFRYANSQVFDRIGRLENAITVADSLGIERTLATTQIARNLSDIDVTLIVGADFEQLRFNLK